MKKLWEFVEKYVIQLFMFGFLCICLSFSIAILNTPEELKGGVMTKLTEIHLSLQEKINIHNEEINSQLKTINKHIAIANDKLFPEPIFSAGAWRCTQPPGSTVLDLEV